MIDLNSSATRRHAFSAAISEKIDTHVSEPTRLAVVSQIVADLASNPPTEDKPRTYIGASAIGDECARRVQLDVWAAFHPSAPAINRKPLDEKSRVIFARGHRTETEMAGWLTSGALPDLKLSTHTTEEHQHGFITGGGQIRGHADGIVSYPAVHEDPLLWETKTLGDKGWRKLWNHGLAKAHPKYDVQTQMLMAYLDLPATLFSALNADTGELYFELAPFDTAKAQAASDRAVHILTATRAGELLPKAADDPTHFVCRFCRFKEECHPAG